MTSGGSEKLTRNDASDFSELLISKVNSLSDSQLKIEIEKGQDSVFGISAVPLLKVALKKREEFSIGVSRVEDLELSKTANAIAKEALKQAKIANNSAMMARIWTALAVLISVISLVYTIYTAK